MSDSDAQPSPKAQRTKPRGLILPIKGFHDTKEKVFSFDWFLLPPGDPREELDQESDSGEEDAREHSGCGRHLQEENTGDQVEHALGQIYFKNVDKYI